MMRKPESEHLSMPQEIAKETGKETAKQIARPLALTLGEPAGIGPDITLQAWQRRNALELPAFYLLGDPDLMAQRAKLLGIDVPIAEVSPEQAVARFADALPVVATGAVVTALP